MHINKRLFIFFKIIFLSVWAFMLSCSSKVPGSFFNSVAENEIGVPVITYFNSSYSFVVNTAIAVTPTITGTPLTNCTVTPTLPIGLTLDASNCAISGTPTTTQIATAYTFTATNAYGQDTASINITINSGDTIAPTVAISYSKTSPMSTGAVTITATYSEPVATTPNISINQPGSTDITSVAMTPEAAAGVYTYVYTVMTANGSTYVDGTATVSLSTVNDLAGNAASAPTGDTFNIDTAAPNAPSIPDLVSIDDSGISMVDNITKQTTALTFQGTAANGAPVGTPVTTAVGMYSIDINLSVGIYAITAQTIDAAGNVSLESAALNIVIDIVAPNAPSLPDLATADDSGISNVDNITNQTTGLTFTGTAESGASVQLWADGVAVGMPVSATGGFYSIDINQGSGTYIITAQATDIAGNVSVASPSLSLTINITPLNLLMAETMDTNSNGKIDHYKLTFSDFVNDSTFSGYVLNGQGGAQTNWLVAGYANVVLAHGSFAPVADTANDNILYLKFTEGAVFDTGAKPDFTTTTTPGLADLAGNAIAQIQTIFVEKDTAKPIVVSATGVGATTTRVTFSEVMTTASAQAATLAEAAARYSITGLTISAASMYPTVGANSDTVSLTTSTQTQGTVYTVAVTSAVLDMANNGVSLAGNTAGFTGNLAPSISYAGSPYTFTQGVAITTITPTLSGGVPTSCSSPGFPAGLNIDPVTCAISGTPTGTQTATSYTITASNAYGNGTANISIAVTAAGTQYALTAGGVAFNMRYVPGKTFKVCTDYTCTVVDNGTATVSNGYEIAETEVTYELWNVVKTWASANGYTFSNVGTMGDGTGDTNQHPVTTINWRDAMVWMNALTEYYNNQNSTALEGVYYTDAAYTTLQKDSSDVTCGAAAVGATAGDCDNPYVKAAAKGFRLPSMNEWELAARYINDANGDGDIMDAGEYYPGSFASGATAAYTDAAATNLVSVNFANSGSSTAAVKSKTANALGLFDMSGNVWEWNFDWHPSYIGTFRVFRGGGWVNAANDVLVGFVNFNYPYFENFVIGFRPSRSP